MSAEKNGKNEEKKRKNEEREKSGDKKTMIVRSGVLALDGKACGADKVAIGFCFAISATELSSRHNDVRVPLHQPTEEKWNAHV